MRLLKITILYFVVCFMFSPQSHAGDQGLNVVSTNSIVGDLVRNVGGQFIRQEVLVGPNGDPHTFEPTPNDNVTLKNADLIFEIGLHLEPWLDSLYESSESKAVRHRISEGVELIEISDKHSDHSDYDPHIWHDPTNVINMVGLIRDALMKADAKHAQQYTDNAKVYIAKLTALNDWISTKTASLLPQRRKLVTSHDTFGYFARKYGFEIVGAVIDSATTEATDPSALKLAQLVEKIKSLKVPTIFVENVSNPQLVETLARETGVRVAPALYSDALGEQGSDGEDYITMMTHNVKIIVEALQ